MQSRRRWPWVVGALILALAALVLCWDWNWFRPQVAREAGAALGRQLSIGHLSLHLGRNPELVADDIAIANPDGFPPGSRTATLGRLRLRIDPRALFHHSIKLTEIELDQPSAELGLDPAGVPNWKLQGSSSSPSSPSPWTVDIRQLLIHDGRVHFLDPKLKSDFQLEVHTEDASPGGEPDIVVAIAGRYSGQPISGRFVGGSVLGLRDANDRYPIDLKLDHGATRVRLTGSLLEPLKFGGADLRLDLEGDDLASLYPLTGIPLAPTAPYKLGGRLDYEGQRIRFRDFTGTVGSSDLEGDVEVDLGRARSYVTASLSSRRVALADLAGFIGAAPGEADSPRQAPKQKAEHARQEASPKLLPDTPINLPKLRSADLDVRYRAQHIEGKTPLDNLDATLTVADGALSLHPLSFAVGQGQIVFNIRLSGEQNLVRTVADVDFRQVELARIMQSLGGFKGAGTIGGKASIDTTGNSLAQMLGRGNGEMKLFMDGGDISALLVDLAGLDFGNGLESALGIPRQAKLRCMVSNFDLDQGTLNTRLMLIDTSEANIIGYGKIDLADEQTDYRLTTQPKHFSVGHLRAPILIRGPLKNPSIMPDPKQLAARAGIAAVLGIFLTPLAALVPTIELGLGKNHDCGELLRTVQAAAGAPATESTPPG